MEFLKQNYHENNIAIKNNSCHQCSIIILYLTKTSHMAFLKQSDHENLKLLTNKTQF